MIPNSAYPRIYINARVGGRQARGIFRTIEPGPPPDRPGCGEAGRTKYAVDATRARRIAASEAVDETGKRTVREVGDTEVGGRTVRFRSHVPLLVFRHTADLRHARHALEDLRPAVLAQRLHAL